MNTKCYRRPCPSATDNFLASVLYDGSPVLSKMAVFAYSVSLIYPLPVYLILIRDNLVDGGLCGEYTAAALANCVPWAMTLFCYMQAWFIDVLNWSSLLFLGFINYSVPLAMYLRLLIRRQEEEDEGRGGAGGGDEDAREGVAGEGVGDSRSVGSVGVCEAAGSRASNGSGKFTSLMRLCREVRKAALACAFFVVVNVVLVVGIAVALYQSLTEESAPSTARATHKRHHSTRVWWRRRGEGADEESRDVFKRRHRLKDIISFAARSTSAVGRVSSGSSASSPRSVRD